MFNAIDDSSSLLQIFRVYSASVSVFIGAKGPLSVKHASSSTKDCSSSSANSSDENNSSDDADDTNGKDVQLGFGFGTPIIEEPFTKF